jgi:3-methylcrotonyl-CoA carboxylase alpha subunit
MEMNTRLQVEHPISEMITGLDFVEWQFLVASGFPLPKKQSELNKKGNAIEVRIYSEDPFNNFLPGNGTLNFFREPKEAKGVRIETGVREKDTISTFYDPMIAKLITYGKDRTEAIELMKKALSDYRVTNFSIIGCWITK